MITSSQTRISHILSSTDHRPWPLPDSRWSFYQEWNHALFLHWKVNLEPLQRAVPKALEIDLFEGKPWVSLVAFTMENIRPRYLPAFPPISNFHEINIRTYVKSQGKSGVYFLSIEGGNRVSCQVAKWISELPYRYSSMKRSDDTYLSSNSANRDRLKLHYRIEESLIKKEPLDLWLTERYALFQDAGSTMNQYEIHHLEWPLRSLEIKSLQFDYSRYCELLVGQPQRTHYSEGVQVLAWGKRKTLI